MYMNKLKWVIIENIILIVLSIWILQFFQDDFERIVIALYILLYSHLQLNRINSQNQRTEKLLETVKILKTQSWYAEVNIGYLQCRIESIISFLQSGHHSFELGSNNVDLNVYGLGENLSNLYDELEQRRIEYNIHFLVKGAVSFIAVCYILVTLI